ncbi:MAG: CvpA family protein [Planctomycetota bacterium]|nr:CvpA family protein [Planctomycetota bacterium]
MNPDPASSFELPRWLDLVGLGLVGLFLVLGARRGLWWQLVRLLGLAAAIATARALAPRLAPGLASALPSLDPRIASGLVWLAILALGLAVIALVGKLGKETIEAAQLGLVDRAGGAVAGALSGALLHGALVLLLVLLGPADWSRDAVRDTRSARLLDTLGRRLPLLEDAHAADALRDH